MRRSLTSDLINRQNTDSRKPLIIEGAHARHREDSKSPVYHPILHQEH
jgi:hypothetical protein